MKISISILVGIWGVLCVLLVALSAGVEWGTPGAALASWFSVATFHALAIAAFVRMSV